MVILSVKAFDAIALGRTQRLRVEAGASACSLSLPPNNIEKTTKTEAWGASSVTPKSGETSSRLFLEGFHATVGPITTRGDDVPSARSPASVKLMYCISAPTFRRSLQKDGT